MGAIGLCLMAAGVVYAIFSHHDLDSLRRLVEGFLKTARGTSMAPLYVAGIYIISGAIMFPISILNLATAIVFGPMWGIIYAIGGSLLNATLFFWIGQLGNNKGLDRLLQRGKLRKIDKSLVKGGVAGIVTMRMLPVMPYALFNIIAGISSLHFMEYIAGTFLALLPGAIGRGVMGDSLVKIFLNPTAEHMVYMIIALIAWGAIIAFTNSALKKYQQRTPSGDDPTRAHVHGRVRDDGDGYPSASHVSILSAGNMPLDKLVYSSTHSV